MKGWCVLAFFDVESYLEYIRNNSPSCKMNHLCTLFAYTRTRMESSLEICVLKYQKWWFMSGEIEIISAFFFILSLHLIFLKPQKKIELFFSFWTLESFQRAQNLRAGNDSQDLFHSFFLLLFPTQWGHAVSQGSGSSYVQSPYGYRKSLLYLHAADESHTSPNIYFTLTVLIIKADPGPTSDTHEVTLHRQHFAHLCFLEALSCYKIR